MTPPVPGPTEGLNAAVAAQIRAEAAAAQLTDKALAEKAGVNYASLRRWLGKDLGNERDINVAVLSELAKVFGLTAYEIVFRAQQRMNVVDLSARRDESTGTDTPEHGGSAAAALEGDEDAGEPEDAEDG